MADGCAYPDRKAASFQPTASAKRFTMHLIE